jgi:uncharacterized membrane protein
MIQRIQSLWLLLAAACTIATFKLSFFSGNRLNETTNTQEFIRFNANNSTIVLILTVIVAVASLVAIFMFKDRKRQMLITIGTGIAAIALVFTYLNEEQKFTEASVNLTSIIHFSIPLLIGLAVRAIYRDEKLVKSADRIR